MIKSSVWLLRLARVIAIMGSASVFGLSFPFQPSRLSTPRGPRSLGPILTRTSVQDHPDLFSDSVDGVRPESERRPAIDSTARAVPLSFEANEGQMSGSVKFFSRSKGYGLFLDSTDVVLSLLSNRAT